MPTFATPEPINVKLEVGVGNVRIVASERTDTVVDVQPSDPSQDLDVQVAAQTRVDYANGTLVIKAPRPRTWGRVGSIDVTVELPAGSAVHAGSATGHIGTEGRLGECQFQTAAGHIRLDQTGPLQISTAAGDIVVDHVVGTAKISTGTGDLRVRAIDGSATIKNSNGASWIGEITGDLRAQVANGDIVVDRALAGVEAKTASGNVRIGEVVRGSIGLETAIGELEVGVREGTAAWLDVRSTIGKVHSELTASDAPERSEETVEVRARTGLGDILIHRS